MQDFNSFGQPIGKPLVDWQVADYPKRTALIGRYCSLEPLVPSLHAADLFEANSQDTDGTSWTYLPYGPFHSLDSYQAWMESTCQENDPLFFAIIDLITGKPTGVASYLRVMPENGSIEVGHIHYSPVLQRSKAATEAMYLMMKSAFELGYRRYEWKCDSLNIASCSAAKRLGFSFEGVFRQASIYKGRSRDTSWFSIIDTEWPNLELAFRNWLSESNFDQNGKQLVSLSQLTMLDR